MTKLLNISRSYFVCTTGPSYALSVSTEFTLVMVSDILEEMDR